MENLQHYSAPSRFGFLKKLPHLLRLAQPLKCFGHGTAWRLFRYASGTTKLEYHCRLDSVLHSTSSPYAMYATPVVCLPLIGSPPFSSVSRRCAARTNLTTE